ncbi:hypothetical protein D3C76_1461980 [compost metagenome]
MRRRLKKAAEAAFVLDNEMSSIRQEILLAQKSFEDDSNIISTLLSAIHQLYFYHLVSEAIDAQERFNLLWEERNMEGMKELLGEVKGLIKQHKKVEEPGDEL